MPEEKPVPPVPAPAATPPPEPVQNEEEDEEKLKGSSTDLITKANEAAERQEKANAELSKLLTRQEALRVEQTLGGTAIAGAPALTQDEKDIAAAKKFLEGTGLEQDAFPDATAK